MTTWGRASVESMRGLMRAHRPWRSPRCQRGRAPDAGRAIIPPMTTQLTSQRYKIDDPNQALEFCFERGWTDGLPVMPPTEALVRAMLDAAELEPDHQIGFITNRQVALTAEKVAINAVMAGCKPDYMPVVVAAVEGLADPRYGYHGPATSTAGAGPLLIVNGPIARRLGFNFGANPFRPRRRAHATPGAALRLGLRSVIRTI